MKTNLHPKISLLAIGLVLSCLVLGCKDPKIDSKWSPDEINVDGISDDWKYNDLYYEKDSRTSIGVCNDSRNLYILLVAYDHRIQRQIMEFGLTVWFDQEGGREKTLGVRFPVGMPRYSRRPMMGGPPGESSDLLRKMTQKQQKEVQLLGPKQGEQKTLLMGDLGKYGVCLNAVEAEGNFVYEMRVPLTRNGLQREMRQMRYAVKTDLAKRIGIGFETGKPGIDEMRGPFGEMDRMPPGGMSGGQPPGRTGGRSGGKGRDLPESLELWLSVKLAVSKHN